MLFCSLEHEGEFLKQQVILPTSQLEGSCCLIQARVLNSRWSFHYLNRVLFLVPKSLIYLLDAVNELAWVSLMLLHTGWLMTFSRSLVATSPNVGSELEQARPQTSGEEELQLQLALAMSREAAEQVHTHSAAFLCNLKYRNMV